MRKGWLSDYERMRPLDGLPPVARGSIDTCVPSDEDKRRKIQEAYLEQKSKVRKKVQEMREAREKESRARLDAKFMAKFRAELEQHQKRINEAKVFKWDGKTSRAVLAK